MQQENTNHVLNSNILTEKLKASQTCIVCETRMPQIPIFGTKISKWRLKSPHTYTYRHFPETTGTIMPTRYTRD